MSGGSMDYAYSKLEWSIPNKNVIDEMCKDEQQEVKKTAYAAVERLNEAVAIAKRLEWFMSGDDGGQSFIRRMKEELGYDLLKIK